MIASKRMEKNPSHMTEKILHLTLDIISLLTGEAFAAVKSGDRVAIVVPQHSFLIPEKTNKEKILVMISKIIELLFTESGNPEELSLLPLGIEVKDEERCVLEEEEADQAKDGSDPPEESPNLLYSWDSAEDLHLPTPHQGEEPTDENIKEEDETRVRGDQRSPGTPTHHNPNQDLHQKPEVILVKVEGEDGEEDLLAGHPSSVKLGMTLRNKEGERSRRFITERKLIKKTSKERHGPVRKEERMDFPKGFRGRNTVTPNMNPEPPSAGQSAYPSYDDYFTPRTTYPTHQVALSEVRPHSCPDCRKSFKRRAHLLRHRMSHTGERPYLCLECGKSFMQKDHLISHQRSHTGERPFICPECGKTFAYKANFNAHRKYHTGQNLHTCPICGKKYAEKCLFERHQLRHTGEKPFACALCTYRCVQKSDLLSHLKAHMGEQRYNCPVCGMGFQRKCLLQEHQKEHIQ